ncbi:hypothetical protein BK126_26265 [Paenibacillus sp. FSL H7-0326]|uniref:hypothetical protein n=1 Tax=Paenibacillus sp. FSL H7-0326 TaxID=1921144 RepID=UPI00096BDE2A|nr:hypothetical protein [Paenibacillus sp. FSL H7-0326]OMC63700.1 hypothetical protein BK126_26265 [Paenibacillus sp. FSL H7-0326]
MGKKIQLKPILFHTKRNKMLIRRSAWEITVDEVSAAFEDRSGVIERYSVLDVKSCDFAIEEVVQVFIDGKWEEGVVKDRLDKGIQLLYVVENKDQLLHRVKWDFDLKERQIRKIRYRGYIIRGDHEFIAHQEGTIEELESWYKGHSAFNEPNTDLLTLPTLDT